MAQNSAEKKILNIGVIGCGCIAQNHLMSLTLVIANTRKIWKGIKPVLYALADINADTANKINQYFPAKKVYTGQNAGYDLIADPEIHVIYVLVPTIYHLDYVLKAAEKGKHVFCEKPLAFSPNDIQKMIEAREKYHVVIQAGLVMRSAPQINYMKKLIEENQTKWGRLTNVIFRDSQEKPYKGQIEVHNSTWRADKNLAHAGILFEHTIHDCDGMIFCLGEIEEVYAKVNYYGGKDQIEDSVAAVLSFKNGVSLTVNSMWNDIDFSQRRFELFFERAYLMASVDERANKAVSMKIKHEKEPEYELDDKEMDEYFRKLIGKSELKPEVTGPYYYEDLRFIDAVVNNKPSEITLEFGKYVQIVIEACYESSRTKKAVRIAEFHPK